nr:myosin regulatory light chain 2, smooth muscle major isoform-like [Aotus nancymaae]
MSSKWTKAKTTMKWAQQGTSNVFVMFDQLHIQEFKKAFNMIDQNCEGFIHKGDLKDKLDASGFIHEDHLWELLTTMGDSFTDEEVDEMYWEVLNDKKGKFN